MNSLYLLYTSLLQLLNTHVNIDPPNPLQITTPEAQSHWAGSNQLSPLSSIDCGKVGSGLQILFDDGGYDIKSTSGAVQWPWMAKILYLGDSNRPECHGILIDRQHILTASTCVTRIQPKEITVRLGSHRLGQDNLFGKDYSATSVYLRGRFRAGVSKENARKLRNDIAIIRLNEPSVTDQFTRPICLTGAFDSIRSEITETIKPGILMNAVDYKRQLIPIWAPEECKAGRAQFCAGFKFNSDFHCPGLPGDPLMVETTDDHWILIGIATSNSRSCSGPRTYSRLSSSLNWIHRIITLPAEVTTTTVRPTISTPEMTMTSSAITETASQVSLTTLETTALDTTALDTTAIDTSTSETIAIDTTTSDTTAPEMVTSETTTSETTTPETTTSETATSSTTFNESAELTTLKPEDTVVVTDASTDVTTQVTTTKKPFKYLGCGFDYNVETRIVGGQPAAEGKWPWMAAIIRQTRLGLIQYCGAVLIDDHFVLSAAHCVKGKTAKDLRVRLGEHDFYDLSNRERDYIVNEILMHENYNDRTFDNDIALLRLRTKVKFTEHIRPICLPPAEMPTPVERGSFITGWGHTSSDGTWSPVLQEVVVPVLSTEKCQEIYRRYGYPVSENQICAGYSEGGKDSCQGDSGGPLMLQLENGKWAVVGVVSWGIGCADPNFPGVYTSTTYFLNWINERINYNRTNQ